jgi:predicted secreted hydrolase
MARLNVFFRCIALLCCASLIACKEPQVQEDTSSINPSFMSASGEVADPNYQIKLPQDHLAHPNFDIEWWYLTANLKDESGENYAFQWTLFRFSNQQQDNAWHQGQIFMAHTSLHSPNAHWFEEKFAPAGLGNAGVSLNKKGAVDSSPGFINLKMDDWLWQGLNSDGTLFPAKLNASVNKAIYLSDAEKMEIELVLKPSGPFILHGEAGYSVKSSAGKHASHYYSLPFIDVEAQLKSSSETKTLRGKAWYDHEWTSTLLDASTAGWDWMSLHLDNGDKIMAFSMRLNDQENYQTGTYISASGGSTTLLPEDISLEIEKYTAVEQRQLPLNWQVKIPKKLIDIKVKADKQNAYNESRFPYYEGSVSISGSHRGEGFLELTGY